MWGGRHLQTAVRERMGKARAREREAREIEKVLTMARVVEGQARVYRKDAGLGKKRKDREVRKRLDQVMKPDWLGRNRMAREKTEMLTIVREVNGQVRGDRKARWLEGGERERERGGRKKGARQTLTSVRGRVGQAREDEKKATRERTLY